MACEFELTGEERGRLVALSRGVGRCGVRRGPEFVLALAEPAAVPAQVAADLSVTVATVDKWGKRFEAWVWMGRIDSPTAGMVQGRVGDPTANATTAAVVAAGEVGAGVGVARPDQISGCAASGATNKQVAAELRVMEHTVAKWRRRYITTASRLIPPRASPSSSKAKKQNKNELYQSLRK